MPDSMWIPQTILTPELLEGLKRLGIEASNPPSGFASGIRVIRDLEDQIHFLLGRLSNHTLENINERMDRIYRYMLNLDFAENRVEKWQTNLPPGHPKQPPPYSEFAKFFPDSPPGKNGLQLKSPSNGEQPSSRTAPSRRLGAQDSAAPRTRPDRAALDKAQSIIYEAWEIPDRQQRITLARTALKISPYCTDAYNLLADESSDLQEQIELYRKAVESGKQSLGDEYVKEHVGRFWGLLETRPFMRGLHGLAVSLWKAGQMTEAIEIYREMLRLNPGDNQGVRYSLLSCLLAEGKWDEAGTVLRKYEDERCCSIAYSRALLSFAVAGRGGQSDAALEEAFATNPFVPLYIIGKRFVPHYLPDYYGWGDENEAIIYAHSTLRAWKKVAGAVEWVKEMWNQRAQ